MAAAQTYSYVYIERELLHDCFYMILECIVFISYISLMASNKGSLEEEQRTMRRNPGPSASASP